MKFFDFLQDVIAAGIVVAVSLFLIDQSDVRTTASTATADDVPRRIDQLDAFGTETRDNVDLGTAEEFGTFQVLPVDPEPAEDVVDRRSPLAPAPLDLDALEHELESRLGRVGRSQSDVPVDADSLVPLPADPIDVDPLAVDAVGTGRPDPVDRPFDGISTPPPSRTLPPVSSSHPIGNRVREFGTFDSFDDLLLTDEELAGRNATGFGSGGRPAPAPTRRLGPVEILDVPLP